MKKFFKTRSFCRILAIMFSFIFLIILIVSVRLFYVNQKKSENPQFTNGNLKIIMIDVENGDCFLALQNDKAMLIDSGYFSTYSNIESVMKENGVQKINYAILTHPHRDHAGGLLKLIFWYKIEKLYISENVENGNINISDRSFYTPMIIMLKYNNLFAKNIVSGRFKDFDFADSRVDFIGPLSDEYEKLNNYSMVFKLIYGKNKILFAADMEKYAEIELLNSNVDVSADILKIGHHGSKTSSGKEFLDAVSPKCAFLSCKNGAHNNYGHPVKNVVRYFEERKIPIYRTDELGNVEMVCDGTNISVLQKPGDYKSGKEYLVWKNQTEGNEFH